MTSLFSYIESQADAIFVEVQDSNRAILGRAIIQVSSFGDCHVCITFCVCQDNIQKQKSILKYFENWNQGQIIRWFPIYLDNNGCIGKLQLSISISISSDNSGSTEVL